jgi:hypothetical protein
MGMGHNMSDQEYLRKISEDVSWLRAKQEDHDKIYMTKEGCHAARKDCKNGKKLDWRWYITVLIAAGGFLLAVAKYIFP